MFTKKLALRATIGGLTMGAAYQALASFAAPVGLVCFVTALMAGAYAIARIEEALRIS